MNVTELARRLKIHPEKLLETLPEFGYDIGKRAVKVDDRVAQKIMRDWRNIKRTLERREAEELEKQKELEKQARKESGATVIVPNIITVRELAEKLTLPVNKLMVELMKNGILASQNENIDRDTAVIMAEELGFKVEKAEEQVEEEVKDEHLEDLEKALADSEARTDRAPVVVVMGHVDHGKTKLLDAIRKANVVDTEHGGITQHIGAYQVVWVDPKHSTNREITFIDTPGHEAFTVMRSRGAKVADIAILVVAADDGVKPQTVEAIEIIKAAKLPVVVAINKIDKEGADVQKAKTELSQHNLIPDDWGGEVPMVEISAKENLNIDKLLDTVLVVADINSEKIKADAGRLAAGTVIEAHVDKGEGPVATILVQVGTLKLNDPLVVNGEIYGKVRAMRDYKGENVLEAGPSCPVRILGFKVAPTVGDVLDVEKASRSNKIDVKAKKTQSTGAEKHYIKSIDDTDDEKKHNLLKVVIKADTLGSLEAIIASLSKLKNEEIGVDIVGKGLGNVVEDDVAKAQAANGIVYAFNVGISPVARDTSENAGVECLEYNIIYDLLDDVKVRLEKLLTIETKVIELGSLKIKAIFRSEKSKMIVGGLVISGKILPDNQVRIKREGNMMGEGKVTQIKVGQQVEKGAPEGTECGAQFEGKIKIEEGDVLEFYKVETKTKTLVFEE